MSLSDLQTRRRRLPAGGMISRMRTAFIAVGLVISLACSSQAQQTPAAQAGQDVAARVGDRAITLRELDDRWKLEDPGQKAQAEQALYDGRKAALDAIIADMLVAQAAKAKNVTPEAFAEAEVGKRVKPVTDADVRTFYVQNSERMQGRPFEQMSAGDPAVPRGPAADDCAQRSDRRAAQGRSADPRADGRAEDGGGRHRRRSVSRERDRAGHGGRVLGLPVPVLRARDADAEGAPRRSTATRCASCGRIFR